MGSVAPAGKKAKPNDVQPGQTPSNGVQRRSAYRIAVIAYKGGGGKTPATGWLAGLFARMGKRVLVIDLDGQGGMANVLGVAFNLEKDKTYWHWATGQATPKDVIRKTKHEGIDIVLSHPAMDDMPSTGDNQWKVTDFLDLLDQKGEYDVVLMDSPPGMQCNGIAAILACDGYVVPLQPGLRHMYNGLGRLEGILRSANRQRGERGPAKELAVFVTNYDDKRARHREYIELGRQSFGPRLSVDMVPATAYIDYEDKEGTPLTLSMPNSKVGQAIQKALAPALKAVQ